MILLPSGLSFGFLADHSSSGVSQRRTALKLLVAVDALLALGSRWLVPPLVPRALLV